jgi:hypothetical protein
MVVIRELISSPYGLSSFSRLAKLAHVAVANFYYSEQKCVTLLRPLLITDSHFNCILWVKGSQQVIPVSKIGRQMSQLDRIAGEFCQK